MKPALSPTVLVLTLLVLVFNAFAAAPQTEREKNLWGQARTLQRDYEQRCTLVDDPKLALELDVTLTRLWSQVSTDLAPMTLKVVQDPAADALTYPNGICYITTGMLARLRNEDQLAMVLAHEAVHYLHRHALNAGQGAHSETRSRADSPELSYSGRSNASRRQAEQEADTQGLHLIRRAGFNATRIIALLNGFEPLANANSTSKYRRAMISAIVDSTSGPVDAGQSYQYDPEYLSRVSPALLATARAAIQKGLWSQAEQHLANYLSVRPDDPGAYFLRGEAQRRNTSGAKMQLAIQAYEKAIRLDREFAPAYRELGVVHLKMGQLQTARHLFETYLTLAPQDESSDYVRGYLDLCGN